MQLEDDNNTPNKTLAEVSIPNKTLATVSNMELGKSNVNKDFLSPSRRICPPFPSLDDLTNKTAAKSKISLSGGKEKTGFNAQGTNGRNLNLGKGSNGPTVGNCGDKQSGCGVCPSNVSNFLIYIEKFNCMSVTRNIHKGFYSFQNCYILLTMLCHCRVGIA